jgi:antitoxin component of MazEF toxin-antitoxin module
VAGAIVLRPVPKAEFEYTLEELLAGITTESIHPEKDWGARYGNDIW